jgi:DNA-binding beta-propeller fold protein YncE
MNTGPLTLIGHIPLPPHHGKGGFDHAAVHSGSGLVYVAHTANDGVDVFHPASGQFAFSISNLPGVAGVLISDERQIVVTSNRAENTIAIFNPGPVSMVQKVAVGIRPNGLACDAGRGLVIAANVGDPDRPGSCTLSIVDLDTREMRADVPVAGRTRWALYDPQSDAFYVNIQDPAQIAVLRAGDPDRIARVIEIPAAGPHGLDMDFATHRLFCACDAGYTGYARRSIRQDFGAAAAQWYS